MPGYGARGSKHRTRMPDGVGGLAMAVARAGADGKGDSAMRRFATRDAVIVTRARVTPAGSGGV